MFSHQLKFQVDRLFFHFSPLQFSNFVVCTVDLYLLGNSMCSLSRHGKLDYFTFILKHQLVHLFFLQNAEVLAEFTNKIWGMEHFLQQLLAVLLSPPLALSPNPTLFSAASLIWENGYRFFKVLLSQSIHQSLSVNCCSCWARNLSICCIVKFHFFPLSRIFKLLRY